MVASAHFTPSLLDADTLERLFVNRHHYLDDALGRIERAAASDERAAKLFVGPRGAGKTHLVSLVYHRARVLPGFGSRFQVAWLPEDLWTIGSLDELAAEIVAAIEPGVQPTTLDPCAAIVEASHRMGPIVVLIENLDAVLDAIGAAGQRRLRGLLENHRPILFVATATRLGDHLLDQAEPFYGFFDTTMLEPFDVDGAANMLRRRAEVEGEVELAAWLDDPRARSRLATVAHLAGGQPRIWALLARGLTRERLDDLVTTLIESFDDLTPYYQQQLRRLSLNERRAVRALAAADGALSVGDLAERTGIEARSLGRTVTDLRRRGWVLRRSGPLVDVGDQRRSYYQLAEPLARLAFQLKESRGRPVALVVEFLKAWFDADSLCGPAASDDLVAAYSEAAHRSLLADVPLTIAKALADHGWRPAWASDPTVGLFQADPGATLHPSAAALLLDLDDALAAYQAGDPEPLLRQPPAISHLIERGLDRDCAARRRLEIARLAVAGDRPEDWVPRLERLGTDLAGLDGVEAAALLALVHVRLSNFGPADVLLDRVVTAASAIAAPLLSWVGEQLLVARQPDRALAVLAAAEPHTAADGLLRLAIATATAYQRAGRHAEVLATWARATARLIDLLGPDHPHTIGARAELAASYRSAGRPAEGIAIAEQVVTGRDRILGPDHPDTITARANLAVSYDLAGRTAEAIAIGEQVVSDRERILGPDHPHTLTARANLAVSYDVAGRTAEAMAIGEQVLVDSDRILGADHPGTLTARANLAAFYHSAGRTAEAIAIGEQVVADCERLLGPAHPDTLGARAALLAG